MMKIESMNSQWEGGNVCKEVNEEINNTIDEWRGKERIYIGNVCVCF